MSNILQFVFVKTKKSRTGLKFFRKWGPFLFILAALFLTQADLTRHVINDSFGQVCSDIDDGDFLGVLHNNVWSQLPSKDDTYCYSRPMLNEYNSEGNLSAIGWIVTIGCTWSGFACLFVGICWAIDLPAKVAKQWRQIRRSRTAAGPAAASSSGQNVASQPLVE